MARESRDGLQPNGQGRGIQEGSSQKELVSEKAPDISIQSVYNYLNPKDGGL